MGHDPNECKFCGAPLPDNWVNGRNTCTACGKVNTWMIETNHFTVTNHNMFPDANVTFQGVPAENYINLAIAALQVGNHEEARDYARKALENQPASGNGWLIKMKALPPIGIGGVANVSEMITYGINAISFASPEQKTAVTTVVYRHYLTQAIVLMANALSDARDVRVFRRLSSMPARSQEGADAQREQDEALASSTYGDLANQAIRLKQAVPESYYDRNLYARRQVIHLSNLFVDYCRARGISVRYSRTPHDPWEQVLAGLMYSLTDTEKLLVSGYVPAVRASEGKQLFFIATAVYGSYDCPELWVLRRNRDERLKRSWRGRMKLRIFSFFNPFLSRLYCHNRWFQGLCERRLDKLVTRLAIDGIDSSHYRDPT